MAHYAFLDENNIVTEVIVGKDEGNFDWEQQYGSFRGQACRRTSFNTRGGVHYQTDNNTPSADQSKAFRKNYAGIGYTYDRERDAFIPPKPFASWVLNEDTCLWDAPVAYPDDGGMYQWDESTTSWVAVEQEQA
jgi:hypothetical protein